MADIFVPTPGQLVFPETHGSLVEGPLLLADGTCVTLMSDGTIRRWTASGAPVGEPIPVSAGEAADRITVVRDWDGRELVECGITGYAELFLVDPATGQRVTEELLFEDIEQQAVDLPRPAKESTGWVKGLVRLSENLLGSQHSHDPGLRIWDVPTRRLLRTMEVRGRLESVAPNLLATADGERIQLRDVETGAPVRELSGHRSPVTDLCGFSYDGRRLLASTSKSTVRMWDVETGASVELLGHQTPAWVVVALPDMIVCGGVDKTIRRWDVATGTPVGAPIVADFAVAQLAAVQSGRRSLIVAASEMFAAIWVWDATSGEHIHTLENTDEPSSTTKTLVAVGSLIAQCRLDGRIQLWDPAAGTPVGTYLRGHCPVYEDYGLFIQALPWPTPDGCALVTGGCDGTIRFWPADVIGS